MEVGEELTGGATRRIGAVRGFAVDIGRGGSIVVVKAGFFLLPSPGNVE